MSNDTTETTEPWLVELLVHSDPGPLVRKHLSLAKVLALSGACKALHELMLNETTQARNFWASSKGEADRQIGVRVPPVCAEMACICGYLSMLVYLHENDCPWDKCLTYLAAKHGHLDCLKYAHEHGCPWDNFACTIAAKFGRLGCLEYAHKHGCPWDEGTCQNAAEKGHLACLKYAHENGCPWDEWTCGLAADNGHWDCLKYACDNKCPDWEQWEE